MLYMNFLKSIFSVENKNNGYGFLKSFSLIFSLASKTHPLFTLIILNQNFMKRFVHLCLYFQYHFRELSFFYTSYCGAWQNKSGWRSRRLSIYSNDARTDFLRLRIVCSIGFGLNLIVLNNELQVEGARFLLLQGQIKRDKNRLLQSVS